MPAPLLSKPEILERLSDTFRRQGYDGASLADIARATGLGKSSLYHYFPGGKAQMAAEVLESLDGTLEAAIFAPLREPGAPRRRLAAMLEALDRFYEGGRKACLLERLAASVDHSEFREPLQAVFARWIGAIESVCRERGDPAGRGRGPGRRRRSRGSKGP